ncbi:hypothetical protein TWF506_000296 [Arthrobotrys conoides]|uniref:Uncharacterized protein n=1 Tax=Arthrobotrys conoides TaxID=74498 RepID=A0AAN8NKP8_9PEZI
MKSFIASATLVGVYALGVTAQPTTGTCKSYTTQAGCPAVFDPCCAFKCTSPEGITTCVESYAFEEGSGMVCSSCSTPELDGFVPQTTVTFESETRRRQGHAAAQRPTPAPPSKCKSYKTETGCPATPDPCCAFKCTSPEGVTTCVDSYAFEEGSGMVCSACSSPELDDFAPQTTVIFGRRSGSNPIVRRETAAPTASQASASASASASAPTQSGSSSATAPEASSSSVSKKAGDASSSASAASKTEGASTGAPKATKDGQSAAAAGIYMMSFGAAFGLGLFCVGLVL